MSKLVSLLHSQAEVSAAINLLEEALTRSGRDVSDTFGSGNSLMTSIRVLEQTLATEAKKAAGKEKEQVIKNQTSPNKPMKKVVKKKTEETINLIVNKVPKSKISQSCPTCGAPPGQPCIGYNQYVVHKSRVMR